MNLFDLIRLFVIRNSFFRFDNQTLKIEVQDMEMTAKELRWKLLEVF